MTHPDKTLSLADAVSLIRDGDVVAIGGHATGRHPMALVREMIRQGRRKLHLVGWNNVIDMDLLIGAGCVTTVETSCVEIGALGPAMGHGRHLAAGTVRHVAHTETTAAGRFRASAWGMPFLIGQNDIGAGLPADHPHLKTLHDPFTGEAWLAIQAIVPDVAIVHAHAADRAGNVQFDADRWPDHAIDLCIARSARTTIVSVEQIVSEEAIAARPSDTMLTSGEVRCVVELPFGAHPCGCDARYVPDAEHLMRYHDASASVDGLDGWLEEFVETPVGHASYLHSIGARRLMELSRRRTSRA